MSWIRKWLTRAIWAVALVTGTLIVGGAFEARWRHPDLRPWHRVVPPDLVADDMGEGFSFSDFLSREDQAFATVRAIETSIDEADRTPVNRYNPASRTHPSRAGRDWNRTFHLDPETLGGGALLVHGLTDSPYSMRAVAEELREMGFYTLALRMPGHGTVPAGLTAASWEDWLAAVRVGARHVRQVIGADRPLVLVGYSNGGALVLKYALDALQGADPAPTSVILLSPMIGVTPAARLAWWISRLGDVPYFEKARWLDVLPEYNPFKYTSFPANAAFQTVALTSAIQADLARATSTGLIGRLPPVLTFQSIVDATVSTPALVTHLYDRLPGNGSELILFDVNNLSGVDVFVRPEDRHLVTRLFDRAARPYRRVLVTNRDESSQEVVARSVEAGRTDVLSSELGLRWPNEVFSLTHIAVPFPVDDALYGTEAPAAPAGLLALGRLSPRGERAVLTVGTDTLMRLSSNPFFPFLAGRIRDWVRQ
jgi:alpha-beta hydrolase superfamily lysophospholipase